AAPWRAGRGAGVTLPPARRTRAAVVGRWREACAGLSCWFGDGEGHNPPPFSPPHADLFIAPADSINMTGEPCATGRPVFVFDPGGGSPKFARFHQALAQYGATRPLPRRFERLRDRSHKPPHSGGTTAPGNCPPPG